jgi:hypothetical protein
MKGSTATVFVSLTLLLGPGALDAQVDPASPPPDPLGIPLRVPLDSVSVTLERNDYFERTPTYRVTLLGTGEVVFSGDRYFDTPGPRSASFDPASLVPLLQQFYDIKFFELAEGIPHRREAELIVTDSSADIVTRRFTISDNVHEVFTVRIGDYSKTVYNRFGGSPVFDDARLGQTIDSIAGVSRWTGND